MTLTENLSSQVGTIRLHRLELFMSNRDPKVNFDANGFLRCLFTDAQEFKATDVHLEHGERGLYVKIRVQGVLLVGYILVAGLAERLFAAIRGFANLDNKATGVPLDGRIQSREFGFVDLRVSFFPVVRGGYKIVFRLLYSQPRSFGIGDLGWFPEASSRYELLLAQSRGLVIFVGPTGSGKTTAVYAGLSYMVNQKRGLNIVSIEDPVEYTLEGVSQSQVNVEVGFTFECALRGVLRQDPQVMMVGEVRDSGVANICIAGGLTGHLVLTTVHGGSSVDVISRLLNWTESPFALSSSLGGVLNVRLMRLNCTRCRESYEPGRVLKQVVATGEFVFNGPFYRGGKGCSLCNGTGYTIRSMSEVLVVDDLFRTALIGRLSPVELGVVVAKSSTKSLWLQGFGLLCAGDISLEELMSKTNCNRH